MKRTHGCCGEQRHILHIELVRVHVIFEYDEGGYAAEVVATVMFQFEAFPINRSIEKLLFRPLTSYNHLDCRPKDQVALLPYLCEQSALNNYTNDIYRETDELVTIQTYYDGEPLAPVDYPIRDLPYRYYPEEQGCFFLTRTHADALSLEAILQGAVRQEDFEDVGTRFHTIGAAGETGLFGLPAEIGENANAVEDDDGTTRSTDSYTIDLADYEFRVNSSVLGNFNGADSFHFQVDDDITFEFREEGYAYTFHYPDSDNADVAKYFHSIVLWDNANAQTLVGEANGPIDGPVNLANWPHVAGVHQISQLVLHLPKRRFSRAGGRRVRNLALAYDNIANPHVYASSDRSPLLAYTIGHSFRHDGPPVVALPATGRPKMTADGALGNQLKYWTWFLREGRLPAEMRRTHPLKIVTRYGTVTPRFTLHQEGGNIWRRIMNGYNTTGKFREELHNIRVSADGDIAPTTSYIVKIIFAGSIRKDEGSLVDGWCLGFCEDADGDGQFNDVIDAVMVPRESWISFRKQDLHVDAVTGYPYIAETAKLFTPDPAQNGDDFFLDDNVTQDVLAFNVLRYGGGGGLDYQPFMNAPAPLGYTHFVGHHIDRLAGVIDAPRWNGAAAGTLDQALADQDNGHIAHTVADNYWNHRVYDNPAYPISGYYDGDPAAGGVFHPALYPIVGNYHEGYTTTTAGVTIFLSKADFDNAQVNPTHDGITEDSVYTSVVGRDRIFREIWLANQGVVQLVQLPDSYYEQIDEPIVRSGFTTTVNLEEPLFAFLGMTPFKPSSVFPQVEYLPGFVQDYDLTLVQRKNQDMLSEFDKTLTTQAGGEKLFAVCEPTQSRYVLQTSSTKRKRVSRLQICSTPFCSTSVGRLGMFVASQITAYPTRFLFVWKKCTRRFSATCPSSQSSRL